MSYLKADDTDPWFVQNISRFKGHLCHHSPIRVLGEVAMSLFLHEQNQISQWLEEEAIARAASTKSIDPAERDQHFIRAEHYADYAWSLAETNDHAFIPSEIWHSNLLGAEKIPG
jgi:hypothetical protein